MNKEKESDAVLKETARRLKWLLKSDDSTVKARLAELRIIK